VSTCLSAHSPVDWVKVLVKACTLFLHPTC
jgi:hypothetical protein